MSFKKFIKSLVGPISYCNCIKPCSQLTVDHVVPKALVRSSIVNDPHNLFICCQNINQEKGSMLFGRDFVLDNDHSIHTGALARACLYVNVFNDPSSLNTFDRKIVSVWKQLDFAHPPHEFEYIRNEQIYNEFGVYNPYVQSFKD